MLLLHRKLDLLDDPSFGLHADGGGAAGACKRRARSASGWLVIGEVLYARSLPTCHDSTYDNFVVSSSLARAVVAAQSFEDAGLSSPFPASLVIRGDAKRLAVRKMVRPQQG